MTFVSSHELNTVEYAFKKTERQKENAVTRKINELAPAEEHGGGEGEAKANREPLGNKIKSCSP